ncbi:efflux RND transporter permease subunit [Chitinophaga japonensis]|uniref:Multidrug efflux pump subunit AcrB n=1 Tax=Chitinophaga japonensis TaxID=104662 RepID=A0A562TFV0_CHIJA|nr:efflux RND transporter permease subunit [Chitinophaga japonensis]TWI92144.1 multidrug efflux pump subunit AcrB [Chitinophaga japonensis]
MNIPKFFIKNWQFTICIFLLAAYWGIQSFRQMPKSEDPLFPLPQYQVICTYPGASPADIEQLVVKPLESALGALTDIEFIRTNVNDGIAAIQVKFLQNADEEKKYDEVQREINKVRPDLPADVAGIDVIQASTSNVNILQYALVTDKEPYSKLEAMADNIKAAIEKVKGVKEVGIHALPQQQVNVEVRLPEMAARGITVQAIANAVQSEATSIPGGYMDVGSNRYNIKTTGDFETVEAIRNTIIQSANGHLVYLKDIADVEAAYERNNYHARYNGKKAVFIAASQQDGTNIFDITEAVEAELQPYYAAGNGIRLEKVFDQSESVAHRLHGLYRDFIIAVLLVLVTLLPLGLRASYVVMLAIPTSIFIGITLLDLAGYSLNQFSIVGLVIALGLLVDDSIIVVENIVAKLRKGESREQAAINGTNQLTAAIAAVTTCIVLSFLPLVTLQGATGDFIRSLPLAVIFTMLGSLFVSLSLTPLVSRWLLKEQIGDNIFYRWVMKLNEGPFLRVLHKCLAWPKTTLLIALALIVAGIAMLQVIGVSFFPGAEKPQFLVNVTLPQGKNTASADSVCLRVEQELQKHPQIISVAASIGKGNPQVYYNLPQSPQKGNSAQLLCGLDHYSQRGTPLLLDSLRQVFARYPGVKIQVKEFVQGPPVQNPIEIRLLGDNTDTLQQLAARVEGIMNKTPGAIDIDNPLREARSELQIRVNHDKALALGVPVSEIYRTIRMVFAGLQVGEFTDNSGKDYNYRIMLLADEADTQSFDVFRDIYVASSTGRLIPFTQIASWQFSGAASTIQHYNRVRSVMVTAGVASGYLTNDVTNAIIREVKQIHFPVGYSYQAGGEIEKRKESFSGLTTALFIAVLAIAAVLVLAFHGVKGTLIVASAIPLGVFGSVIALWLGGYTFSFTAFIGIVTLVGLEVKNTIIIVDFTNQMRALGHDVDKAIELAREERFTPIFLTTLTAVFALIPLVLERSDFFSPLALVLIGGLLSSLFLTRFVEPVLYKMLMK